MSAQSTPHESMNGRQQHGVLLAAEILDDYEGVVGTTALEFLLADLMHWCTSQNVDFDAILKLARERHQDDAQEDD